jgi:hypothetical protein
MSNQFWMIWPDNVMASALILFVIAMPFLYAARKLVHDLLRSAGHMVGGALAVRHRARHEGAQQGGAARPRARGDRPTHRA